MRLILASTSPRRREILALLGLPFEVIEPNFDERVSAEVGIEAQVLEFAIGKAQSVAVDNPSAIVIGSDTLIGLDDIKIGKPRDLADAKKILRTLSGKTHCIYTAVALIGGGSTCEFTAVERVSVDMHGYSDDAVDAYLACGESLDKAGAYSIQGKGAELIAAIRGDYLAAVGLPLRPIAEYLSRQRAPLPLAVSQLYADKAFLNWHRF